MKQNKKYQQRVDTIFGAALAAMFLCRLVVALIRITLQVGSKCCQLNFMYFRTNSTKPYLTQLRSYLFSFFYTFHRQLALLCSLFSQLFCEYPIYKRWHQHTQNCPWPATKSSLYIFNYNSEKTILYMQYYVTGFSLCQSNLK